MSGALVLGSDYRGLGAVQSLGRHGVHVWVLHDTPRGVASFSRYAERSIRWPADDNTRLSNRYEEARRLMPAEHILVQELIPGGGQDQFSFAALASDGMVLASLVARRTRQYPMEFGRASTFVETVDAPEVAALGAKVIEAMGYTGLVEVEFKHDV